MGDTKYDITADLITALLRNQHPDLAELPLKLGALGWDNQMWRLGDDLAIRLPWSTNPTSGELLLKEHAVLPAIHNDKIAALGVAFGNTCEHIHDHGVLFMCLGQVWRDGTVFDEMPEVVRVKMNLGRAGFFGKGLRRGGLP